MASWRACSTCTREAPNRRARRRNSPRLTGTYFFFLVTLGLHVKRDETSDAQIINRIAVLLEGEIMGDYCISLWLEGRRTVRCGRSPGRVASRARESVATDGKGDYPGGGEAGPG